MLGAYASVPAREMGTRHAAAAATSLAFEGWGKPRADAFVPPPPQVRACSQWRGCANARHLLPSPCWLRPKRNSLSLFPGVPSTQRPSIKFVDKHIYVYTYTHINIYIYILRFRD